MRMLIIEDDELVGDAVAVAFERDDWSVDWVRDGESGAAALAAGGFELAILDLGLPVRDGLDVLREARRRDDRTPIVALTARDGVRDRISGLDCGADDYVVKPFDMGELRARCRALVRRAHGRIDEVIRIDDLVLDPSARSVAVDGAPVSLPGHEFRVLRHLMERRGRVVARDQLEQMLYGWSDGVESNTVEVYISQLRRKIGAERIRTLRGVGYMMP